nr:MAG TPA: hypothetical protein [Caudoviricetes sp.]
MLFPYSFLLFIVLYESFRSKYSLKSLKMVKLNTTIIIFKEVNVNGCTQ